MCWLYSMSNLFVIQHLETLYLGGNNVRVECEEIDQVCKEEEIGDWTCDWLMSGDLPNASHVWSMLEIEGHDS